MVMAKLDDIPLSSIGSLVHGSCSSSSPVRKAEYSGLADVGWSQGVSGGRTEVSWLTGKARNDVHSTHYRLIT